MVDESFRNLSPYHEIMRQDIYLQTVFFNIIIIIMMNPFYVPTEGHEFLPE